MIWGCCKLMTGLCSAEELVFPLCNRIHLLGSPWQEGGREQAALFPGRVMVFTGRNGRNVPPFQGCGAFSLFGLEGVATSSYCFRL